MTKKNDLLIHYASKYYDPVERHERYMRERELKGRRSTTNLNDEGKEIWWDVKNNITSEKKSAISAEREKRDKKIEALRAKAKETKTQISSTLKTLRGYLSGDLKKQKERINTDRNDTLEELSSSTKKQRERIAKKRDQAIEALRNTPIPKGIDKETRARLVEQRNAKIAKLRSDAKTETTSITDKMNTNKAQVREAANAAKTSASEDTKIKTKKMSDYQKQRRQKVTADLKTAVQAARDSYKKTKESLNSSYENTYQQEYDKIRTNYGKSAKK